MTTTKIYTFSATGTGLKIAKDISKNLDNCEIISIAKIMQQKKWSIEGDTVGFVFPCFYGEMPQIVRRFVNDAENIDIGYSFAVATAGGDIGYSLKKLNEALSKRNNKLDYGRGIIVGDSYMNGWYYDMIFPSDKQLAKNVQTAKTQAKIIAEDIKNKSLGLDKPSYRGYITPIIISPKRYVKDTSIYDSEFSVSDACTGCEICARVCPVDNIEITDKKPAFSHNCQRCMACIQLCPESAFLINKKPMNKKKYIHPDISLKDLVDFNG